MTMRVRRTRHYPPTVTCRGAAVGYEVLGAWRVEGCPEPRWVVETATGDTVVDERGEMLTCWYVGLAPTKLARLVLAREAGAALLAKLAAKEA